MSHSFEAYIKLHDDLPVAGKSRQPVFLLLLIVWSQFYMTSFECRRKPMKIFDTDQMSQ